MDIVIIVLLVFSLLQIFKPKIKGFIGEKKVSSRIKRLPKPDYKILNDIYLQTDRGTTQVDHVVISVYGIFVIETKNYKGWISGSEQGENWTQNIYGNKKTFRNPIYQNYGHIKALEQILGNKRFISIIAFSHDADLNIKIHKANVIYMNQITRCILNLSKERIYTINEVNNMVALIEQQRLRKSKDKKQHVETTKQKINESQQRIKDHVCPRCGGTLIKRHGKFGDFYGCSNFPKCRFTAKIS